MYRHLALGAFFNNFSKIGIRYLFCIGIIYSLKIIGVINTYDKRPLMMRSGKSGQSAELLTTKQQAPIDRLFSAKLKQLKSDFPYDEMFP